MQEKETRGGMSRTVLLAGAVAAVLGGGAFAAVYLGLVPLVSSTAEGEAEGAEPGRAEPAPLDFVALEPLVISLGPSARARHLRVALQVEVVPEQAAEVRRLTPRLRDVLNTFLRAVDERDVEEPRAMGRLRAQMLRRIQLVCPPGAVRDLLIQEFVLN